MYEHPIYKSAVIMQDQEECDFAKDLCIKYELPIWEEENAFDIVKGLTSYLYFYDVGTYFMVGKLETDGLTPLNIISLEDFEELCEGLAPEQDINDIISTIKELNNIVNK